MRKITQTQWKVRISLAVSKSGKRVSFKKKVAFNETAGIIVGVGTTGCIWVCRFKYEDAAIEDKREVSSPNRVATAEPKAERFVFCKSFAMLLLRY